MAEREPIDELVHKFTGKEVLTEEEERFIDSIIKGWYIDYSSMYKEYCFYNSKHEFLGMKVSEYPKIAERIIAKYALGMPLVIEFVDENKAQIYDSRGVTIATINSSFNRFPENVSDALVRMVNAFNATVVTNVAAVMTTSSAYVKPAKMDAVEPDNKEKETGSIF